MESASHRPSETRAARRRWAGRARLPGGLPSCRAPASLNVVEVRVHRAHQEEGPGVAERQQPQPEPVPAQPGRGGCASWSSPPSIGCARKSLASWRPCRAPSSHAESMQRDRCGQSKLGPSKHGQRSASSRSIGTVAKSDPGRVGWSSQAAAHTVVIVDVSPDSTATPDLCSGGPNGTAAERLRCSRNSFCILTSFGWLPDE